MLLQQSKNCLLVCLALFYCPRVLAFVFAPYTTFGKESATHYNLQPHSPTKSLDYATTAITAPIFGTTSTQVSMFGKLFEEEGPLGKGITVGKISVAMSCIDRTILTNLERAANKSGGSSEPEDLSFLANEICLNLLRQKDNWIAASSESKWFGQDDAGKAESLYNDWSNKEAAKFEKEYIPTSSDKSNTGGPTNVVVSLVIEIQGDETDFDGAGYSFTKTNNVISSIAADVMVDDGYCLNAVEVFWCPGDRNEVLSKNDLILDFPALVDL